ncbi:Radical SAM domain protein [uncultured Desulfobacterium sp.]|uniref:Radical SAM domain protein n=1 Tax=uncultured Desulfobacterium sp. TaxID=201089 RepID=A0A445MU19_9BACT|nr:Radical SAM domain protein [uncultured Desulfobacterium sp.]
MTYVFGPVPSRRLGMSLGVDLIPPKTCTYDCLYCQVGRTTKMIAEPQPLVPVDQVISEIKGKLSRTSPDTITLAGSGEPTLNSDIGRVISGIKGLTRTRVAVLTNGSLFSKEDVRRRVLDADIILPTLTSVYEETFKIIHRPHPGLFVADIIDGIIRLRNEFKGQLFLEVVFLAGINHSEREIEGLKAAIGLIAPDRVQLNTVVRPPADERAISLDNKILEEIMVFFGGNTEIIAGSARKAGTGENDLLIDNLLEMIKRRPLKTADIATALGLQLEDVEDLIKGLLIKGRIRKQQHSGDVYYLSNKNIH